MRVLRIDAAALTLCTGDDGGWGAVRAYNRDMLSLFTVPANIGWFPFNISFCTLDECGYTMAISNSHIVCHPWSLGQIILCSLGRCVEVIPVCAVYILILTVERGRSTPSHSSTKFH